MGVSGEVQQNEDKMGGGKIQNAGTVDGKQKGKLVDGQDIGAADGKEEESGAKKQASHYPAISYSLSSGMQMCELSRLVELVALIAY